MSGRAGVLVEGPLALFADGFRGDLAERGYSPGSVQDHVELVGHLSFWMVSEKLDCGNLSRSVVERFVAERRAQGCSRLFSLRGMSPFLGYLGGLGVLPVEVVVDGPAELLLEDFRRYLLQERGLAVGSVELYEGVVRLFLAERSEPLGDDLARLSGVQITAFVLREAERRSVKSAETVVYALRSLLGFLHVQGWMSRSLVSAVPKVASRRRDSLPRALEDGQVALLLASCDRESTTGRRNLAILLLLARLGLRAGEVAALELGDVDWRAGEIIVRGKGPRLERMPLPCDVGEAIADYLRRQGPARGSCRRLFMRACAPRGGLSSDGVSEVVRAVCRRAALTPVGSHRLRHTLACDLLRAGASFPEIGQVLRHRNLQTTAIYARVDREALVTLALPWPGSQS